MSGSQDQPGGPPGPPGGSRDQPDGSQGSPGGRQESPEPPPVRLPARSPLVPEPIPSDGTAAPPDAERIFANRRPVHRTGPRPGDPGADGRAGTGGPAARGSSPRPGISPVGPYGASERQWGPPMGTQDRRRIQGRGRVTLVIGIGSVVFSVLFFPLGLALGVAAIILAVLARRTGRRTQLSVPGATVGLALGIASAIFSTLILVVAVVFWGDIADYQSCVSGANTNVAQTRCMTHFEDGITERIAR